MRQSSIMHQHPALKHVSLPSLALSPYGCSIGAANGADPAEIFEVTYMLCADWPGDEGDTGQRKSVASGAKYVEKLNEEFSKRAPMFQDDALFIRCPTQLCPACWSNAGGVD